MSATKVKVTAELLAECFRAAKSAAIEKIETSDGGTCNLDSPAFRLPCVRDGVIQEAARLAEVTVSHYRWIGGRRWYWLTGFLEGQAARRSAMSTAATQALREIAEAKIPQMDVMQYFQVD